METLHMLGQPLETQPCLLCHGTTRKVVATVARDGSSLTTVACTGCGLVHSHPLPTAAELEAFYAHAYRQNYKATTAPKLKHTLRYAPGALRRVQEIARYCKPYQTRWLDVGAGSGEFTYMAQQAGFSVQGIEPHAGYAGFCADTLGLPVQHSTLEDTELAASSIAVINLNHVLEHMRNPLDTLLRLHALLEQDGLLAVSVPNLEDPSHAPERRFHYAHIYNFNHATLKGLLYKAGFTLLEPGNTTTTVVARKSHPPTPSVAISNPINAEHLWDFLTTQSPLWHYTRSRPYRRLLQKSWQYPREWVLSQIYPTHQQLLQQVWQQHRSF